MYVLQVQNPNGDPGSSGGIGPSGRWEWDWVGFQFQFISCVVFCLTSSCGTTLLSLVLCTQLCTLVVSYNCHPTQPKCRWATAPKSCSRDPYFFPRSLCCATERRGQKPLWEIDCHQPLVTQKTPLMEYESPGVKVGPAMVWRYVFTVCTAVDTLVWRNTVPKGKSDSCY